MWEEHIELEHEPVGSGCMAQVYRGRLQLSTGARETREVAVKVRHPGARENIDDDLGILRLGASALEFFFTPLRLLSLTEAVAHFEKFILAQVDLRMEATNIERFRHNFEYNRTGKGLPVVFPEVIKPFVAEDVLVESFECGAPLSTLLEGGHEAHHELGLKVFERAGQLTLDLFMKMLFTDNFVHGDLHPGNVLIRTREDATKSANLECVVLDAGLAVRMSDRDQRNFLELFHAVAMNDGHRCGTLILERTPGDRSKVSDEGGFVQGVATLVKTFRGATMGLGDIGVGDTLMQMLRLAFHHGVQLETSFVNVVTSIVVVEGVGRQLDPLTDIIEAAKPLLVRAASRYLWSSDTSAA